MGIRAKDKGRGWADQRPMQEASNQTAHPHAHPLLDHRPPCPSVSSAPTGWSEGRCVEMLHERTETLGVLHR